MSAADGARNLRALLPTSASGLTLTTITRAGTIVPFTTETIKGVSTAVFSATTGGYQAIYR